LHRVILLLLLLIILVPTTILITNRLHVARAQTITCPHTTQNDIDGDGIPNTKEVNGVDINNDGHIDLNLTALGASPLHKDIFLEIDYMQHHRPNQTGIDNVVRAFDNAPVCNPDGVAGISLHVRVDDEIPHNNLIQIDCSGEGAWPGFISLKKAFFGTASDRHDLNAANIIAAMNTLYHYAIFIHQFTTNFGGASGQSGCSDPQHMNLIVSLGGWQGILGSDTKIGDVLSNPDYEAGTLMHELGHTLNLGHGGNDWKANYKPNYLSVMNWNFQFPSPVGTRPLDYSKCAITSLNESNLDENKGIDASCPVGLYTWAGYHNDNGICPPDKLVQTNSSVDWNGNGKSSDTRVKEDINCDNDLSLLNGYDDWNHIAYIRNSNVVGSIGSVQGQPYIHQDRTAESVLKDRSVLLTNLNETTKDLPQAIGNFYSSQIGLSNATSITIPTNATSAVVVRNATGSFAIQNATNISIPGNATTHNFAVQNATNISIPGNATTGGVVVSNATGSFAIQNGTKVKNATDITSIPGNATTGGVVVSNATGSFAIQNATNISIPGNATSGVVVKNTTSLADLIVKSNNITGAIKKIDKLSKTADSSVGGVSTGDLVVDPTTQKKIIGALDNLRAVLSRQSGHTEK
jgi:hypothetical protein